MPQFDIRRVEGDDLLDAMRLRSYAFRPTPPLPERDVLDDLDAFTLGTLHLGAYEDDRMVATIASSPMTQHVRGSIIAGGGIWGVASHPGARRKGYIRALITRLFEEHHANGEPLSTLYPFRESFYERLGYVLFPYPRKITFQTSALAPLLKKTLPGMVELYAVGENWEDHRAYLHHRQHYMHGMAVFDDSLVTPRRPANMWHAMARVNGEVVGEMTYRITGQEDHLIVRTFYYDDQRGKYLLLEWLARHVDHARDIEIRLGPFEHPESWISDLKETISNSDAPMGRVVDLAALQGLEVGPGSISVRVDDPQCPWNVGCFTLEGVDGKLRVSSADNATCDLSIQAISALVYGTHDPGDFAMRGWGEPSQEAISTLRSIFPPLLPHIHELF